MESAFVIVVKISKIMKAVACIALTFMMVMTVADVLLRAGGPPIVGTYEIVALSLALVVGFAIPKVSLDKQHVYMEFLVDKLRGTSRNLMHTFTRLLCIFLFGAVGINLFNLGNEFASVGEVSSTLQIPFFPVAYGVGVCCLLECVVFLLDIVRIWSGRYE